MFDSTDKYASLKIEEGITLKDLKFFLECIEHEYDENTPIHLITKRDNVCNSESLKSITITKTNKILNLYDYV